MTTRDSSLDVGVLSILVLDDEANVRRAVARLDLGPAMTVHQAATAVEADALLVSHSIDVALVDQHLGADQPLGLEWLASLRERDPDCFRIIFTGAADLDFAVQAINRGLIDAFLTKPWSAEQAVVLMHQGAEACLLRRHNRALLQELSLRNTDLLTFHERLERLVEERTLRLREANERLRRQQQALVRLETHGVLSHLARGMAHELNNPLAVILGYAQRLKRSVTDQEIGRRLDIILQEVDHCRGLVDQLRRLAAPLDEDTSAVSIEELLRDILRERADHGEAVPTLLVQPPVPEVIGARGALRRVLVEIVENALHAGAHGLSLSGRMEYGRAFIHIGNDGATPTSEEIENATKPFFTSRAAEGARGLGLAVAEGMLRDQEGHLELIAAPAGGAQVIIQLTAPESSVTNAVRVADFAAIDGRVLVVDDDQMVGELLGDVLHDLGLRVQIVRTCTEARQVLATSAPSAVISDLHLPDGSGEDLLTELTAARYAGRVALITGSEVGERPFPVMGKPFRLDEVAALMTELLKPAPPT